MNELAIKSPITIRKHFELGDLWQLHLMTSDRPTRPDLSLESSIIASNRGPMVIKFTIKNTRTMIKLITINRTHSRNGVLLIN